MKYNFKNIFAQLPEVFHTKMLAEKFVQEPQLLHYNDELATLFQERFASNKIEENIAEKNLDTEKNAEEKLVEKNIFQRKNFENNLQQWIEGTLAGLEPLAMVYAGHQFGHYVSRLGDGRALLLAQVLAQDKKLYDLQLKGSGLTPYSRMGDGRAVLRSCIREYLCGEAMHCLGVSTSRALALIATNENVLREEVEHGAIILRVAASHIRFGHFEYFYYSGQHEALKTLADHVIENYFPDINSQENEKENFMQNNFFQEECGQKNSTHGNFFQENSVEKNQQNIPQNKYQKFLQQVVTLTASTVAKWQAFGFCHGVMNTDNMSILGDTIDYGPFGFLENYDPNWICNHSDYSGRYAYKEQPKIANWNIYALCFALQPLISLEESAKIAENFLQEFEAKYFELMRQKIGFTNNESVDKIWQNLLQIMEEEKADYTLTFSNLAKAVDGDKSSFLRLFENNNKIKLWLENYLQIIAKDEALNCMKKINPHYILRNWVMQTAIEEMQNLVGSNEFKKLEKKADGARLEELFTMIKNPFAENVKYEKYATLAPKNYRDLCVSCSS